MAVAKSGVNPRGRRHRKRRCTPRQPPLAHRPAERVDTTSRKEHPPAARPSTAASSSCCSSMRSRRDPTRRLPRRPVTAAAMPDRARGLLARRQLAPCLRGVAVGRRSESRIYGGENTNAIVRPVRARHVRAGRSTLPAAFPQTPPLRGVRSRRIVDAQGRVTPTPVTVPAWPLCSATGSAALLTLGPQPRPAGYFRIARIRRSGRPPSSKRAAFAAREALQRQQRGNDGPDRQSVPSPRGAQVSGGRAELSPPIRPPRVSSAPSVAPPRPRREAT